GGAVPPRLIRDFQIPESQIVAKITSARMVAPSGREVPMPIDGGYVGMVDREHFDEFLRNRAASVGAKRLTGSFLSMKREETGLNAVSWREKETGEVSTLYARAIIGADGARSKVASLSLPDAERVPCVFAYHEIVESPAPDDGADFTPDRCDVFYQGRVSPDFYGWVFPHGKCTSVGVGSANKGFSLRNATATLREAVRLDNAKLIRHEGAPIPLKPLKRWDDGHSIIVSGDAAGVVAPSSGEGIYYAMESGRVVAETVDEFLASGSVEVLATARKKFLKSHGRVFWILGIMQHFWYKNDKRRERFVSMCDDPDVQRLTWQAYMNKELVRANPLAHVRIFFKDIAHLMGIVSPNA
ncbi:MAG: geranylgeranyl diphosphate reductase, partial [Pseudomonadota bacterium]